MGEIIWVLSSHLRRNLHRNEQILLLIVVVVVIVIVAATLLPLCGEGEESLFAVE